MSAILSEKSIPLSWPSAWSDSKALEILTGTPVNCIVGAPPAIAEAARGRGLTAVTHDEAAAVIQFVSDPQWPGVRAARQADGADAGPTGAPWVDSNAWSIRLAQALDPSKRVWVEAAPEKGSAQTDASYLLAVVEPAAFGARWVIALDEKFAKGLAEGDVPLKARWKKMMDALRFFEGRPAVSGLEPRATVAVISDFQGDNEFLGKEFLNMADRKNLLYRIAPKRGAVKSLPEATRSVVYLDEPAMDEGTAATLRKFVQAGGMVIASRGSGVSAWDGAPAASAVPGYTVKTIGKGRVAVPEKAWSDPFMVVAEVRILVGRRTDVVRMFNEGTVSAQYFRRPDGKAGVIHLVNYAREQGGDPLSLAVADPYTRARVMSLEHPAPAPVKIVSPTKGFPEIPVPLFSVYSAVELERS